MELAYDYNINDVYFDGIQLYKEQFGQSYANALITISTGLLGNNMFAYCNNDPVNKLDPSGMIPYSDGFFDEAFQELGKLIYEMIFGEDHPERQYEGINIIIVSIQTDYIILLMKDEDFEKVKSTAKMALGAKNIFDGVVLVLAPVPTTVDDLTGVYKMTKGTINFFWGFAEWIGELTE